MITKKTWEEFRKSGFLWWINTLLHMFGWAIVVELSDEIPDKIIDAYPARVKYRGFSEKHNTEGYIQVSEYMKENAEQLAKEAAVIYATTKDWRKVTYWVAAAILNVAVTF